MKEPADRRARAAIPLLAAAALLASCSGGDGDEEIPAAPVPARPAAWVEGVALAVVYDTSGSMKEPVADGRGGTAPKYVLANAALGKIVDDIEAWRAAAPKDAPRRVEATLVTFGDRGIPLGPFDAAAFRAFAAGFDSPGGPTPLGNAMLAAGRALVRSDLQSKHVLVVTDGRNTDGATPEAAMDALARDASSRSCGLSVHFVAFDVDAGVFSGVRAKGASVVGASDGGQLDQRLRSILEEEILLETPKR
jgi:hypothetical protein